MFPACAQSFPSIGMQSDMTNHPAYLQFNSAQQLVSYCGGLVNNTEIIPTDMGVRRNMNVPVSMPETFLDSSCFTVGVPSVSCNVHVLMINVLMFTFQLILIFNYMHCSKFYPPYHGKVISKTSKVWLLTKEDHHPFLLSHLQVATDSGLVKSLIFP